MNKFILPILVIMLVFLAGCQNTSSDITNQDLDDAESYVGDSPEELPSQNFGGEAEYTLEDIALHASESDCWTAINGNVYDLTEWISVHPGGSAAIVSLCGTDGSSVFNAQHGGNAGPETTLDGFYIGVLI